MTANIVKLYGYIWTNNADIKKADIMKGTGASLVDFVSTTQVPQQNAKPTQEQNNQLSVFFSFSFK